MRTLFLLLALAGSLAAWAQPFPAKPVRIIVPTAPGGGMDNTARVVGGKLQEYWGQTVLIENRAGASMIIGAEAVAKSPADGYTLLVAHDGTMAMNPVVFSTLPYDPQRDFAPVSLLTMAPLVAMVHPGTGFNSILCFGTLGGWPRFAPDDLGAAVKLANAFIGASGRKVDWMHIPVLDRNDDAFFAPLQDLRPQGARVYLGMVHNMERFRDRVATARKYLQDFGVGAFCGFGRMPPGEMPRVLKEHQDAIRSLGH